MRLMRSSVSLAKLVSGLELTARPLEDCSNDLSRATDVLLRKRGVHQEHQAGFAKVARNRKALGRPRRGCERLFAIDFAARAAETRYAVSVDFADDAVT